MRDDRRPTERWIRANIRRCSAQGIYAAVARRGETRRGTVLLKLNMIEAGCRVLSQLRDMDGGLGWLAAFDGKLVPEAEADAYIDRAVRRDPDLWVVEIKDRLGRNVFGGEVL
ncbi:MAG: DUF1491 family protein [Kiloniellales bacterium]